MFTFLLRKSSTEARRLSCLGQRRRRYCTDGRGGDRAGGKRKGESETLVVNPSVPIAPPTPQPSGSAQPVTATVYSLGASSSEFSKLDDITTAEKEDPSLNALVDVEDEVTWKNKCMFKFEFRRTPKHLTWAQLGREVDCLDCSIEPDPHRPEEIFAISFYYRNLEKRTRTQIFHAVNDVSHAEGLTDLLAAIGTCLSRGDVHRTIRFDDGKGCYREINLRKTAKFTSDIILAFRPAVKYDQYKQVEEGAKREKIENGKDGGDTTPRSVAEGVSPEESWGFHPTLMDPEYRDLEDPKGTYHLTMSAHAFSNVVNRALERLIVRPLKDFYRPSQVSAAATVGEGEEVGLSHAIRGWLGMEVRKYPQYTPLEALQANWLGDEAPFHMTAIICRLRELSNMTKKNPETVSWLSVRMRDTSVALRNVRAKRLGAGPSSLFLPHSFNPSVNQLLPKHQRRRLKSHVSVAGMLGYSDQTKNIGMGSVLDEPLSKLTERTEEEKAKSAEEEAQRQKAKEIEAKTIQDHGKN